MKRKTFKAASMGAVLVLSLAVFSCKEDPVITESPVNADSKSELNLKAASLDLPGRVLASNCFQCHGTNGYAGELKIAGEGASEIISELNEMKSKNPQKNIMNAHARAYTTEEIKIIANYISKQ
jgi:cytochrome subunit of sulfide dehydrogenase